MTDWVFEENLRSWLEIVSHIVGHVFDDRDWEAVQSGVGPTDSERDGWFDYPLGDSGVVVLLARKPGSEVLVVEVHGADQSRELLLLSADIAKNYHLQSRTRGAGDIHPSGG